MTRLLNCATEHTWKDAFGVIIPFCHGLVAR